MSFVEKIVEKDDFTFINDNYTKRNNSVYCWLLCAQKMGIMKDLRLLIAKSIIEQSNPLYKSGDELFSISKLHYRLVNTSHWQFFQTFGIPLVWSCRRKLLGYFPCKICFAPMSVYPYERKQEWDDYWNVAAFCTRHGVFHYKR